MKLEKKHEHRLRKSLQLEEHIPIPAKMTSRPSPSAPLLLFLLFSFLLLHRLGTIAASKHAHSSSHPTPPPLPLPPLPSAAHLRWQLGEMALFLHFGTNTFTDSEVGSGAADPSVFAPSALDARQWAATAATAGFERVVLTAKHHDGFCLWPSAYTDYSVRSSPWRGGRGDVVAELAAAAKEFGVDFGVYLSPWDRHESCYGQTAEYNEYYLGQMRELLSNYGDIREVWLDGAKGENEKDMQYFFKSWFQVIHQLQPGAVIFSDAGPDIRWIGDEAGVAGYTCWSLFNKSSVTIGHTDDEYQRNGDPYGIDWVPAECDVSIRPGWFWHSSEHPKSALDLLDIYYKSVGRNCLLILNVPPNSSGLISEVDLQVLRKFTALRTRIFSNNFAQDATVSATSVRGGIGSRFSPSNVLQQGIHTYWAPEENETKWALSVDFKEPVSFNVFLVQEPIQMGQRIIEFHVDILEDGEWHTIIKGTTIGYKRILRFRTVETQSFRLLIKESRAEPLISYIGIYADPFSADYGLPTTRSSLRSSLNVSQSIRQTSSRNVGNESRAIM